MCNFEKLYKILQNTVIWYHPPSNEPEYEHKKTVLALLKAILKHQLYTLHLIRVQGWFVVSALPTHYWPKILLRPYDVMTLFTALKFKTMELMFNHFNNMPGAIPSFGFNFAHVWLNVFIILFKAISILSVLFCFVTPGFYYSYFYN